MIIANNRRLSGVISIYYAQTKIKHPGQQKSSVLWKKFECLFFIKGFMCIRLLSMIIDQNQSIKERTLKRLQVGGLPLIHAIAERMKLKDILYKYIPT